MIFLTSCRKVPQCKEALITLAGWSFAAISVLSNVVYADALSGVANWNLPANLSDQNTSVRFEVDSTWHMVHGKVSNISGTARLSDPNDPSSIQVSVEIPIKDFNTDNSMRDSKLRNIMDAEKFPRLHFVGAGLTKKCTPALVLRDGKCHDSMPGTLTIRDVTKDVMLSVEISKASKGFVVTGQLPLTWAEYGVEDPSILVAKVEPLVTTFFTVDLNNPS